LARRIIPAGFFVSAAVAWKNAGFAAIRALCNAGVIQNRSANTVSCKFFDGFSRLRRVNPHYFKNVALRDSIACT
jgi:hypothetical protein